MKSDGSTASYYELPEGATELPDWACGSYRAMLGELSAMETDVLRHVHVENHVLMPRFAGAGAGAAATTAAAR